MKSSLNIPILLLLLSTITLTAHGSTITASSSSESDVAAAIAKASNGDTVQIPCSSPTSVTWATTLTVTSSITITGMGATPNSDSSTFGAGTNCLTIYSQASTLFELNPTYSSTNNVTTLQNLNLAASSGAGLAIHVFGTETSSGAPQVRIDNILFSGWTGYPTTNEFLIIVNNAIGVADHNTLPAFPGGGPIFISINRDSYHGVGSYGDNSWAQPDSMGFADNFFIENNSVDIGTNGELTENEQMYPNIGGGRTVARFNQITAHNNFFITGGHGVDTDGRPRAMRHTETYGNSITCNDGECHDVCSYRDGTGLCWGNTVTTTGSAYYDDIVSLANFRADGDAETSSGFGSCGNAASGAVEGAFDYNDNVAYYSGTASGGSGGQRLVDTTQNWSTGQFDYPNTAHSYSLWDITSNFVAQIVSNTSNSLTINGCVHGVNGTCSGFAINAGDSYQVRRSTACLDAPGRGAGALLTGNPAVLESTGSSGPANEVLDPIYEWNNTASSLHYGVNVSQWGPGNASPFSAPNRDFYTDNSVGSPRAQTSSTSPFNGTSGVGFGTTANRPPTCTTGVGYFATDQGNWNTSGNGFGQGVLYKCTSTNNWTSSYTPFSYPHPLVTGNTSTSSGPPAPPQNLVSTVM